MVKQTHAVPVQSVASHVPDVPILPPFVPTRPVYVWYLPCRHRRPPLTTAVHWTPAGWPAAVSNTNCCVTAQYYEATSITCTHAHTHTFNGPFSRTTRVSWYQKGKTNLGFTEARDSEWQWYQLGHMQVCTSLQTDNHASNTPLSIYRPDAYAYSIKALKATSITCMECKDATQCYRCSMVCVYLFIHELC